MHYLSSLKKQNKKRQLYIRDVQPTRPTHPYLTRCNRILLLRQSDVGPELQNPTSAGRFQVSSFKTCETRPTRRHQIPTNSQAFRWVVQPDLADFGDQNNQIRHRYTRFGDSRHDLGGNHQFWRNLCQIRLDLTGSWTDWVRDLVDFGLFSVVFSRFQLHPKP